MRPLKRCMATAAWIAVVLLSLLVLLISAAGSVGSAADDDGCDWFGLSAAPAATRARPAARPPDRASQPKRQKPAPTATRTPHRHRGIDLDLCD